MTFLTSWLKSCLNMTVFLLLGILMFMCVVLISQCQRAFLNLIDSFNLVQSVSGPTQKHRHTLDLVLSYGLPFFNQEICDAVFSDHIPVLFEAALAHNTVKPRAAPPRCRIINPSTTVQFLVAFNQNSIIPESVCSTDKLS